MAAQKAAGINPSKVDPRAVLAAIAADTAAPASARVAAARELLAIAREQVRPWNEKAGVL
jgi:hypothetical protein